MRIPGPGDLVRIVGAGYEAAERVIALVPRLVALVSEVDLIIQRVQAVVSDIETTQQRAGAAVDHVQDIQARVDTVLGRTGDLVDRTEVVVARTAQLSGRIEPLIDRYEPTLDRLEPLLARLADTTSLDEINAVVKLVDALPTIVDKLDADILPVLDTLATVAPDLRDLLDVSKELNELIGSVPGLGRVKEKIEQDQQRQDGYRAWEEPPAAPDRRQSAGDKAAPPGDAGGSPTEDPAS